MNTFLFKIPLLQRRRGVDRALIREQLPEARVKYVLRKMLENKLVRMEGKKKGAKYVLP